jgi:hypothetical protein
VKALSTIPKVTNRHLQDCIKQNSGLRSQVSKMWG